MLDQSLIECSDINNSGNISLNLTVSYLLFEGIGDQEFSLESAHDKELALA